MSFKMLISLALVLAITMTSVEVHAVPIDIQPRTSDVAHLDAGASSRDFPNLTGVFNDGNAPQLSDSLADGAKPVKPRGLPILAAFVHDFNPTQKTDGLGGKNGTNTQKL